MASFVSGPALHLAQDGPIYHRRDLARMRHAYDKAYHGIMPESSDLERTSLAKAIVCSYRTEGTEQELVVAARNLIK